MHSIPGFSAIEASSYMKDNNIDSFFEDALFRCFGEAVKILEYFFTSGGCINNTAKLITSKGTYFIKWNEADVGKLFSAEVKGLHLLSNTKSIKIPEVIGHGQVDNKVFLILEFIESRKPDKVFWEHLGSAISQLHKSTNEVFGLDHDNFIGSLPQKNSFNNNWILFFIENRLDVQIGLAYYNGLISLDFLNKFKNIYRKLPELLPEEKPALLHGDLWSGNFMVQQNGNPCLIDPAVYYGNREVEISFTKLFGGFEQRFYDIYNEEYPLLQGFNNRVDIYNMYYLLVHVNLFGTSYLSPVERTIKKFQ
jgi:fructosamine-3-kinase